MSESVALRFLPPHSYTLQMVQSLEQLLFSNGLSYGQRHVDIQSEVNTSLNPYKVRFAVFHSEIEMRTYDICSLNIRIASGFKIPFQRQPAPSSKSQSFVHMKSQQYHNQMDNLPKKEKKNIGFQCSSATNAVPKNDHLQYIEHKLIIQSNMSKHKVM